MSSNLITEQDKEIADLKDENEQLKSRVDALEKKVPGTLSTPGVDKVSGQKKLRI